MPNIPWGTLGAAFSGENFPVLYMPIWVASLASLVVLVALYIVQTRTFRHGPPREMYEWLLWTGIVFFGLLLTYSVFVFDFFFVVFTVPAGLAMLAWIRFIKFPPELRDWELQLERRRTIRGSHETIRAKGARAERASNASNAAGNGGSSKSTAKATAKSERAASAEKTIRRKG